MNAEHLHTVVQALLDIEQKSKVAGILTALDSLFTEFLRVPSSSTQEALDQSVDKLSNASVIFEFILPDLRRDIAELGGARYFNRNSVVDEVKAWIAYKSISPGAALQNLQEYITSRANFITSLRSVQAGFETLGIGSDKLNPGDSELKVSIPRALFDNNLGGLQKELRILNSVIRTFYELANTTPQPIVVRQISSSDPTFFLGVDLSILVAIGLVVKWCIDVVKGGHDVRKIVEDARKADVSPLIVDQMDKEIQKKVDEQIDKRINELLEGYTGDISRKNELKQMTRLTLRQLLERIERGMKIEPRALAPPNRAESDDHSTQNQAFEQIEDIALSLDFPQIEGEPLLQLSDKEREQS